MSGFDRVGRDDEYPWYDYGWENEDLFPLEEDYLFEEDDRFPDLLDPLQRKFPGCWNTWGLGDLFDMGFQYEAQEIPLQDPLPSYRYCGNHTGAQWLAEWEHPSPVRAL
jgi:hypothetical protein